VDAAGGWAGRRPAAADAATAGAARGRHGAAHRSPPVEAPADRHRPAKKKEDALAGLERWRARHPEAAKHLAEDDVLVDGMRGRSSLWYRVRVNLRHVPEGVRPPEEPPDPDYDITQEWSRG
jgi:hypothetical protein